MADTWSSSALAAAAIILVLPFFVPKVYLILTAVVGGCIAWLLHSQPSPAPRGIQVPTSREPAAFVGAEAATKPAAADVKTASETPPAAALFRKAAPETDVSTDAAPMLAAPGAAAAVGTGPVSKEFAAVKPEPSLERAGSTAEMPAPKNDASTGTTAAPASSEPLPGEGGAAPAKPVAGGGGAAILARLRAQRAASKATGAGGPRGSPLPLTVLYASQTGTAQEIAQTIGGRARELGLVAKVASLDEFGLEALTPATVPILVVVASSTGDGDPPDNAARFYGQIKKRGQDVGRLKGMRCTVLGLGDSNYTQFCRVPRALRTQFVALGATEFYEGRDADEVDGLESIVEEWLAGLWPALKTACLPASPNKAAAVVSKDDGESATPAPLPECRIDVEWMVENSKVDDILCKEVAGPSPAELAYRDAEGMYSPEQPFYAPLSFARWLTRPTAGDRKVLHCELDVSEAGATLHPGDSLGVKPENPPGEVEGLLRRLGLQAQAVFNVRAKEGAAGSKLLPHLHTPCSIGQALRACVDITSPPRKSLLRLLGEHCTRQEDRGTLLRWTSRAGRGDYAKAILGAHPSLLELLVRFDTTPPLASLLDALPPLVPRLYSIANSQAEQPGKAAIALSMVRFETSSGSSHEGVATTWLERVAGPMASHDGQSTTLSSSIRLPVYFRRGGAFHPPASLEAPWVMIGPGTGVAPFIGFLQERRNRLAAAPGVGQCGPAWLFFGCRHPDHDYLYNKELHEFEADGTLDRLLVAFSRTQVEKVYVQHLMREHAGELRALLSTPGATVYVCGDGSNMAAGVHAALSEVLGGGDAAAGLAVLTSMAREGRYVRDIWS